VDGWERARRLLSSLSPSPHTYLVLLIFPQTRRRMPTGASGLQEEREGRETTRAEKSRPSDKRLVKDFRWRRRALVVFDGSGVCARWKNGQGDISAGLEERWLSLMAAEAAPIRKVAEDRFLLSWPSAGQVLWL
jgi:hypothetical protein